ncbi:hypothetical protein [Streptomyces sp. UG1]|uniref:hypothetical protein n=1 Tax=Streptomyces sp. UG1 TaxID=3417652 RepID=UPI003CF65DB7
MKRSSGVRIAATVAVSALSLALVTGCSDSGSGDAKDSTNSASSSSPSAPAAKPLTTAELEKLLLTQGEVEGYKVTSGDDTLPKSKSEVKTDKAECDPLAWSTGGLAPGDTDANASNSVAEDKASTATAQPEDAADLFDVNLTFVGLSSYEGDGAAKAMKAVSDGVTACSGGYSLAAGDDDGKVTKVASEKGSGLGDESLAFVETVDMGGEGTATFHTEVVRKGNTIATFYAVNIAALSTGGAADIPAAVVEAQVAKLK